MTTRTLISYTINALKIFSTIYAQDFHDEVGDRLVGRQTVPIVWPEGSRIWILVMLTTWSIALSWACDLAISFSVPFCCLSLFVGLRFFRKRTADADRRSYLYYNVRRSQAMIEHEAIFIFVFADMACGRPSRTYSIPVTETEYFRPFNASFYQFPLISVSDSILSELGELARVVRVAPSLVFSRPSSFICTPPRANVYALFHMKSQMSETQR